MIWLIFGTYTKPRVFVRCAETARNGPTMSFGRFAAKTTKLSKLAYVNAREESSAPDYFSDYSVITTTSNRPVNGVTRVLALKASAAAGRP